jgi:hypothetical protein
LALKHLGIKRNQFPKTIVKKILDKVDFQNDFPAVLAGGEIYNYPHSLIIYTILRGGGKKINPGIYPGSSLFIYTDSHLVDFLKQLLLRLLLELQNIFLP